MNKLLKIVIIIITIFFLSLYFSNYNNTYYQDKTNLTEEAIKKYEKDLKENKPIVSKNYIPKEKNYNNNFSKLGINTSNFIEKIINKTLKFIVKNLE
jgi:ABC-type dipeptide/oligopeptide/nickel transport system permease component